MNWKPIAIELIRDVWECNGCKEQQTWNHPQDYADCGHPLCINEDCDQFEKPMIFKRRETFQ